MVKPITEQSPMTLCQAEPLKKALGQGADGLYQPSSKLLRQSKGDFHFRGTGQRAGKGFLLGAQWQTYYSENQFKLKALNTGQSSQAEPWCKVTDSTLRLCCFQIWSGLGHTCRPLEWP
jgi:hypothetical protein